MSDQWNGWLRSEMHRQNSAEKVAAIPPLQTVLVLAIRACKHNNNKARSNALQHIRHRFALPVVRHSKRAAATANPVAPAAIPTAQHTQHEKQGSRSLLRHTMT
jgi:hypothetical protein